MEPSRARAAEKKGGKKEAFAGKAAGCGPGTGYYRIELEDGEYDEFDDDDMQYFKLAKEHKQRKPPPFANQVAVPGFFPKGKPATRLGFSLSAALPVEHSLSAGPPLGGELGERVARRDFLKHPSPAKRKRWGHAGCNEFGRLAQGFGGAEGVGAAQLCRRAAIPSGKKVAYARCAVGYPQRAAST